MDSQVAVLTTEADIHRRLQASIEPAVWGYVRVSSDKQEEGQSPEAQADEIRAYCAQALPGLSVHIVQETASAALPMFSVTLPGVKSTGPTALSDAPRPLLGFLLASLCDRPGSHLVVWKLDRLARVATEQDLFLSLLTRHRVTLHTAYASERHLLEGLGSKDEDPIRHLMRTILAAFAEYERKLIHMRMRMGSRKKAAKGGWLGGNPPFGYKAQGGELVISEADANSVVWIFFMREYHNRSLSSICDVLNGQGGQRWNKMRISRIVRSRRLYEGIYDDPYGIAHARPDLKILPDDWEDYARNAERLTHAIPPANPS